jgi:hypothetical protein
MAALPSPLSGGETHTTPGMGEGDGDDVTVIDGVAVPVGEVVPLRVCVAVSDAVRDDVTDGVTLAVCDGESVGVPVGELEGVPVSEDVAVLVPLPDRVRVPEREGVPEGVDVPVAEGVPEADGVGGIATKDWGLSAEAAAPSRSVRRARYV